MIYLLSQEDVRVEIRLPYDLYRKVKTSAEDKSFPSVEGYIVNILNNTFKNANSEKTEPFSEDEDEELKKRLRSLGYM